jgi:probable HAF family extracellular repeat protein
MYANIAFSRRRLLRRLPLVLPLALAAPMILYPTASARELPFRRVSRQSAQHTETLLADVPDGLEDNAVDINEEGIIVGWSSTEEEMASLAVVWRDPDHFEVLPDLGGLVGEAIAINDSGQIAGMSINAEGDARPVLWSDGEVIDLGTLGGLNGVATGVNNRGQVVGYAEAQDGMMHAFLWDSGEMTDLHQFPRSIDVSLPGMDEDEVEQLLELAGNSYANDINEAGQVVGRFGFPLAFMHAVTWTNEEMVDLGTLGGFFSEAMAINNEGLIVGGSDISMDEEDSSPHAFLWRDGAMTNLDAESGRGWSRATDINADGLVCGRGGASESESWSLLWHDGEFITLAANGYANGLNDAGIVVGRITNPEERDASIAARWEPLSAAAR